MQNGHIAAHFEYFFTCHNSKTVRLFSSQRDKNSSLWENLFPYQAKIFSFCERVENKKHFFVSLKLPLFSPKYIALKRNQEMISKIFNYLT